jgi:hypothetical protein
VSVPLQEAAAWAAAAVRQQEAVAQRQAAVRQREARAAAVALLRAAASDVVQRLAALPSAVPWVFPRDQLRRLARLAPQPAARFAHAKACFRIASR